MLPSALQALGFSVMHTPLGELPAGLSAALAGIEAHDTLIVQVSGILGDDGWNRAARRRPRCRLAWSPTCWPRVRGRALW